MSTAADRRLTQTMAQLAEVQLQLDGERLRRQDSDALFERVFSGMSDAILLMDARGRVSRANRAAVRLTGRELEALLELRPRDIFGPEVPASASELFGRAERGTLEGVDTQIERAGRDPLPVSVSCAVIHDAHGRVIGAVYAARDMTERRSAERHREAQLAVTGVLAVSSTVAEALPELLGALGETLAWDLSRAWMVDGEAGILRCRAVWERGAGAERRRELEIGSGERTVAKGEGLPGAVWESGQAAWEDGLARAGAASGANGAGSSPTSACVAIATGSEVAGVLEFYGHEPRPRDDRLVELLSALGAQIGNFIERRQAEDALGRVELFRTAFENAPVGMGLFGVSGAGRGRLLQANAALCSFLARSEADLIGEELHRLSHPEDLDADLTAISGLLDGEMTTSVLEARYPRSDGRLAWGVVHRALLRDETGNPLYGVVQVQDITERKHAEDQLAHQALHDGLTGLPNRVLFLDRLGHALARTHRDTAAKPVVMFVDLDRFKVVNDSLGHGAGDELLVETATRIESALRPGDTVARLGGDEFTVLCEGVAEVDAIGVAERIAQALALPFTVQSRNLFLSASIGIASSSGPDDSPELLVRDADAAMYRAKGGGGGGHAVFSKAMLGSTLKRLELESSLRRAIDQNELCLFYQPEVSLDSGAIVGFEALIRWRHPERGMVSPAEFIPLAEETGLIVPIGAWVLGEACREAQGWREHHPEWGPLKISVNISPRQLAEPGLADLVRGTLAATGTRPEDLWLEVTETVVMDEGGSGAELLAKLEDIGVGIAIDDFGVGFSSLSRLKELPRVDAVKLDKSFIDGVCETAGDRAIVTAGIALAQALQAVTVAEGIETAEQASALRELNCELAQGYFFARPMPPSELGQLFAPGARTTG